jgi:hypothetical protein
LSLKTVIFGIAQPLWNQILFEGTFDASLRTALSTFYRHLVMKRLCYDYEKIGNAFE